MLTARSQIVLSIHRFTRSVRTTLFTLHARTETVPSPIVSPLAQCKHRLASPATVLNARFVDAGPHNRCLYRLNRHSAAQLSPESGDNDSVSLHPHIGGDKVSSTRQLPTSTGSAHTSSVTVHPRITDGGPHEMCTCRQIHVHRKHSAAASSSVDFVPLKLCPHCLNRTLGCSAVHRNSSFGFFSTHYIYRRCAAHRVLPA